MIHKYISSHYQINLLKVNGLLEELIIFLSGNKTMMQHDVAYGYYTLAMADIVAWIILWIIRYRWIKEYDQIKKHGA